MGRSGLVGPSSLVPSLRSFTTSGLVVVDGRSPEPVPNRTRRVSISRSHSQKIKVLSYNDTYNFPIILVPIKSNSVRVDW